MSQVGFGNAENFALAALCVACLYMHLFSSTAPLENDIHMLETLIIT